MRNARTKSIAGLLAVAIASAGAVVIIHPTTHHGKVVHGRTGKVVVP